MTLTLLSGCVLRAAQADITAIEVDAIVNAANSALVGGGGVDGAIHRAGGPSIMGELAVIRKQTGGCPTGQAVATAAGALQAKFIFHAVGPIYRDGEHGEPALLASCYKVCLRMARQRALATIAFPSISTGVYGYPSNQAARIALRAVMDEIGAEAGGIRMVHFVLFGAGAEEAYQRAFAELR